jgi:hypothetical protein
MQHTFFFHPTFAHETLDVFLFFFFGARPETFFLDRMSQHCFCDEVRCGNLCILPSVKCAKHAENKLKKLTQALTECMLTFMTVADLEKLRVADKHFLQVTQSNRVWSMFFLSWPSILQDARALFYSTKADDKIAPHCLLHDIPSVYYFLRCSHIAELSVRREILIRLNELFFQWQERKMVQQILYKEISNLHEKDRSSQPKLGLLFENYGFCKAIGGELRIADLNPCMVSFPSFFALERVLEKPDVTALLGQGVMKPRDLIKDALFLNVIFGNRDIVHKLLTRMTSWQDTVEELNSIYLKSLYEQTLHTSPLHRKRGLKRATKNAS